MSLSARNMSTCSRKGATVSSLKNGWHERTDDQQYAFFYIWDSLYHWCKFMFWSIWFSFIWWEMEWNMSQTANFCSVTGMDEWCGSVNSWCHQHYPEWLSNSLSAVRQEMEPCCWPWKKDRETTTVHRHYSSSIRIPEPLKSFTSLTLKAHFSIWVHWVTFFSYS